MKSQCLILTNSIVRFGFFWGIALAVPTAVAIPEAGDLLRRWPISKFGVFAVFLTSGLTIDLVHIKYARKNLAAVTAALLSSLTLFPALTLLPPQLFFIARPDFMVGALILSAAPVTIASGAVMTSIAGGDLPLSLFICITDNIAAIFTVPFSLDLTIHGQGAAVLPIVQMITNLFLIIIVPIVIGQVIRMHLRKALASWHKGFWVFSQFVILLHGIVVALNFAIARVISLDRAATAAFTIRTSQKTLTVSYLVRAGYFAVDYPMAVMPAVGYHLTQMVADTLLAHRLRSWVCQQRKPTMQYSPTETR